MLMEDLNFLVVEDHPFQRAALVRLLAGLGAKGIHDAVDGEAALRVVQDPALVVDIIVTDLEMPGMDGMEFLRHLGETGVRVSIILASALEPKLLASIATMSEAYGMQLLGVIEKPLTRAKLVPLIDLHSAAKVEAMGPERPSYALAEIANGLHSGEFEPFFQPKVALFDGRVTGVEALARWRHPRHGVVEPSAFIALMEQHGLIDELTWVMLGQAADFCTAWRASGADVTVSVNLSARSLGDAIIAERLTELVQRHNTLPSHMVLEVTESAATTHTGQALENLARLRMKGFGLSIDDYGTGYSSMQQLTRIAFTELKIDQSFVMHASKQASARVILESSLDMAKKLSITSVAEGVETQADYDLLRQLGCDVAQGYFIARPMEASACMAWFAQRESAGLLAGAS